MNEIELCFWDPYCCGTLYKCMGKLRTDRKALQAKLNIRRGSGLGRAIKKALLTKTRVKVPDRGLKMTEMTIYERIYNRILTEAYGQKKTFPAAAGDMAGRAVTSTLGAIKKGTVAAAKGTGRFLKRTYDKPITGPESKSPIVRGARVATALTRHAGTKMQGSENPDIQKVGKAVHAVGSAPGRASAAIKKVISARRKAAGTPLSDQERQDQETSYSRIHAVLVEGKKKQADIESDKELTRAGASSSSDPKSKRYSPSLHTMHNAPESVKRRKHNVVIRRSDRSNQRHADDVAKAKDKKRQRDQAAIDQANKAEKKRRGHPSSTQERMRKELGDDAYDKLSTDRSGTTPVKAARDRKKK